MYMSVLPVCTSSIVYFWYPLRLDPLEVELELVWPTIWVLRAGPELFVRTLGHISSLNLKYF